MKFRSISVTVAIALVLGGAASPAGAAEDSSQITGVVQGIDGPIPNAVVGWVETVPGDPYGIDAPDFSEVIAADDGSYVLDIPADIDPYYVYVNDFRGRDNREFLRDDYVPLFLGANDKTAVISALLDPLTEALSGTHDLTLTQSGSVSGTVPSREIYRGDVDLLTLGGMAVTGAKVEDDGKFVISGLAPGSYRLSAEAYEEYRSYESPVLEVKPGATTEVPIDLAIGGVISGRISAPGVLPEDVRVRAVSARATQYADMDTDGSYSLIGLPAGDYTVTFTPANDLHATDSYRKKKVKVDNVTLGHTRELNTTLSRGGSITGKATARAGTNYYTVTAVNSANNVVASWYGDGHFTLLGLDSGTYTLDFVNYARKYYETRKVTVRAGKLTTISKTNLLKKTVTLSGVVANGPQRTIALFDPRLDLSLHYTSEDGEFSITGLIPGRYTAIVESHFREPAETRLRLTKSTRKTLQLGKPWGKLTADVWANGFPVQHMAGSYEQNGRDIMAFEVNNGFLEGHGPSGTLTLGEPGFSPGAYLTPYWYDFPKKAKTVKLKSGVRTSLGRIDLELHGG